jgi:hypothetical protein
MYFIEVKEKEEGRRNIGHDKVVEVVVNVNIHVNMALHHQEL